MSDAVPGRARRVLEHVGWDEAPSASALAQACIGPYGANGVWIAELTP